MFGIAELVSGAVLAGILFGALLVASVVFGGRGGGL